MARVKRLRKERPFFLIPIVMGMAGVLFSRQLDDPLLRGVVVLLCVAVPLAAGGNILARIRSQGVYRFVILSGLGLLTLGVVAVVSGYTEGLVQGEYVSPRVGEISRWLGMGSLLLGVLAVLFTTVRSEALIDELSERFRLVADNMGEGFFITNAANEIVLVNRALVAMAGLDEEKMVGRNARELARELGAKTVVRATDAGALASAVDYEVTWSRNGEERRYRVNGAPIRDRRGRILGALATVRDVTAEHALSRQLERHAEELEKLVEERTRDLQKANEELRELDRMKDIFLSNVSHELRTPLSTVQGYIEMLREKGLGERDDGRRRALDAMERNAERLSRLINEMIEFSRMELRGVVLHYTLFDPRRLVDECVASAHPQALAKSIEISGDVAGDVPCLWGDREKLSQTILIFLSNAVKFSNPGSKVRLEVSRRDGRGIALAVADAGIGIAPEFHELIFTKFYQVDSSRTRHYQGTGIGLSIAKSIAEAHGGAIEVASAPNQGSTFTLVLPGAAFQPASNNGELARLDDLTVLIVNSQPEFAAAVEAVLASQGARVAVVATGHDAVRGIEKTQPDLVLIDEALRDQPGADAAERLKIAAASMELPVVLFLGRHGRENDGPAPMPGIEVLPKPFTVEELINCVKALCERVDESPDQFVRAK